MEGGSWSGKVPLAVFVCVMVVCVITQEGAAEQLKKGGERRISLTSMLSHTKGFVLFVWDYI
jgi:hypothetical protein